LATSVRAGATIWRNALQLIKKNITGDEKKVISDRRNKKYFTFLREMPYFVFKQTSIISTAYLFIY
jgi:hypothetical protein